MPASSSNWTAVLEQLKAVAATDMDAAVQKELVARIELLGQRFQRYVVSLDPYASVLRESSEHLRWRSDVVRVVLELQEVAQLVDGGAPPGGVTFDNGAEALADVIARLELALKGDLDATRRLVAKAALDAPRAPEPPYYVAGYYSTRGNIHSGDLRLETAGEVEQALVEALEVALAWIPIGNHFGAPG